VATYTIDIRSRARRSLSQLDPAVRKAVAQTIDALSADPRPAGATSLKGHRPYLRVRSGDYRVIYPARLVCLEEVSARVLAALVPQRDQAPQVHGDVVGLLHCQRQM
jgi:mRNA-degrading endonuclease RelE of RelBE toxin-antitoxin system